MPSRVKLLNAAAAGTTGPVIKIGMGQPPYTIRVEGGFSGTGVDIESSPDDEASWANEIGVVGGENFTEVDTAVQELTNLPNKTIAIIDHYVKHIRAVAPGGLTGNATVWLEMNR